MNEHQEHHRKTIRLKGYNYSSAGGYFVTIVTHQRASLFGEINNGIMRLNDLGRIVQECWDEIPTHFPNAKTDEFIIMPNHLHGVIFLFDDGRGTIYRAPTTGNSTLTSPTQEEFGKPAAGSLPTIIRTFKAAVSRRANREFNSANIWQRNYYEHIIRNQADYENIAGYIIANPTNWANDDENPEWGHDLC